MYLVTPFPNILYALDLTNPGTTRWSFEPKPASAAQGVACCDVENRGAAYADGRVFFNTLDNHTVAVDAETGKEMWRTRLGDINRGESRTMAPLAVKGKVLVGNSGGEFGVRGGSPPWTPGPVRSRGGPGVPARTATCCWASGSSPSTRPIAKPTSG